ncbi:hypothetical protein CGT94_05135 [Vibrio metoecus]|uniref:hypothetical protein n=1 Tax=Vibrio metoecus TaxID=1481663 RepID=UPI0006D7D83C|nr:hypothetical protein [Vibrio metoecus]KQB07348.1 hypothetical protein XV93_03560 [Vibrio metoecus]PAR50980.1 hypothetical protein CGT94_05135 [Vibrio metoecus]
MVSFEFSKFDNRTVLHGYGSFATFVDGELVSNVIFDSVEFHRDLDKSAALFDGETCVCIVKREVFDLLCEFRKQDEAPVMGADSSSQCTQGGAA